MQVHAIFGPPGTGKTRELVGIAEREQTYRPLFLSFTKAAAAEALSRVDANAVRTSTLHSLAFNSLNMNRASVVDQRKLSEFGKSAGIPFKGSEPGSDEAQEGDEFINVLAFSNNHECTLDEAYDRFGRPGTEHRFRIFVQMYLQWKKTYGFMDFDDMLKRFITDDRIEYTSPPVVILDEAQDCSPLQWRAFERAVRSAKRVYIAGDDDQAIYEWNGADPHGMIRFVEDYEGTHEILTRSYRVPKSVHKLATGIIGSVEARVPKTFAARQAPGTIKQYSDIWKINFADVDAKGGGMVLVRDRWRLDEVKRSLNREMTPYSVLGGVSPWDSKLAQAILKGDKPEIPPIWHTFYKHADLKRPRRITVSTIHQAKGRESPRVIVDLTLSAKVEADLYLNRDAEVRVMYVALTRTSDELHLCGGNPIV